MLRRGGGEGVKADAGKMLLEDFQPAVLGAEVVAPLANAVGFVDRDERQLRLLEELKRALGQQPFGGDVDELQFAAANLLGNEAAFGGRERAVDRRRRDATRLKG